MSRPRRLLLAVTAALYLWALSVLHQPQHVKLLSRLRHESRRSYTSAKWMVADAFQTVLGGPHEPEYAWCGAASVTHRCNRTLVVVVGSLRGGKKAWQSLLDHVVAANGNADLAIMLDKPLPKSSTHGRTLRDAAKFVWSVPPASDWGAALDRISKLLSGRGNRSAVPNYRSLVLANAEESFMGPMSVNGTRAKSSGAVQYSMRYWLKREMKQHRLHTQYGRFVLTRSDHFYACDHDVSLLDPRYLWVPHVEDAGGVCDRHVVCSSRDLYKCLSLADQLLVRPEVYDGWIGNMEMWWELRLYELGLLRRLRWFARPMFTVGVEGDGGFTAPKKETEPLFGTRLKYVEEYIATRHTCGLCSTNPSGDNVYFARAAAHASRMRRQHTYGPYHQIWINPVYWGSSPPAEDANDLCTGCRWYEKQTTTGECTGLAFSKEVYLHRLRPVMAPVALLSVPLAIVAEVLWAGYKYYEWRQGDYT